MDRIRVLIGVLIGIYTKKDFAKFLCGTRETTINNDISSSDCRFATVLACTYNV